MTAEDLRAWQAVLDNLGKELELEGLRFSEDGYCSMALDNGRLFHLDVQEEGLTIMTELGEAPIGERRLEVLETLLGANAFWVGTKGARCPSTWTAGMCC